MSRNSLLEAGAYLKFKWQQRDSNPQPLSSETNAQPFRQIHHELSARLRTKWLWVRIPLLSLEYCQDKWFLLGLRKLLFILLINKISELKSLEFTEMFREEKREAVTNPVKKLEKDLQNVEREITELQGYVDDAQNIS